MCNLPEAHVQRIIEENALLKLRIEHLTKRLEQLERLLARLDNPHTPSSKSYRRRPRIPPGERKRPGQKPGHAGTTRPVPEPGRTVTATAERCGHCKRPLGEPVGYVRRVIEDLPDPAPVVVTEYRLSLYACDGCGKETMATHPACPRSGRFGKNLRRTVALMKHRHRMPYRKIAEALRREHGLDLSPAAALALVRAVADAIRPEYRRIRRRVRRAEVVNADETSMPVDGKNWWTWTFSAGADALLVCDPSRGGRVATQTLGTAFLGVVVCDGWRPYQRFPNAQRCWAHLLREADFAARQEAEAAPFAAALRRMLAFGKSAASLPDPERRRAWRKLRRWMGIWTSREYESPQARKLAKKAANGGGHWFTFVLVPGVPPTNNAAERALRETVVQRKIIGTLRNKRGTFAHETIMSCLATWENKGLDVYEEMGKFL